MRQVCQPSRLVRHAGLSTCDSISTLEVSVCCMHGLQCCLQKKVANFRLSSWGHINPQIYSKVFTGGSKAKSGVHHSLCCLSTAHIPMSALYTLVGQPRRHALPLLSSVVTPMNLQAPSALLTHHPDKEIVHYLTCSLHFGFSTGYAGPHITRHALTSNLQCHALCH